MREDGQRLIQVGYPLTEVRRATAGLDQGLLALIPIGVIGAWLGAVFLTSRVLGRVKQITLVAERMGHEDLSQRLPAEGDDEFADLASTFNRLFVRLEEAFDKQASALEQQRRFTADASHELKTPLTVIKGTASMAISSRLTEERAKEALTEIDHAADSMVGLVQDLLYLARSDSGTLGADRKELLVLELLQRARSSVSALPGPEIEIKITDDSLEVCGNEGELVRLLSNLFSNARRHTPGEGRIEAAAKLEGAHVVIRVEDSGSGIAPEHLARLGERFYRADEARSREDGGTGLGLAIAKGIVEAHGGTMKFESQLGVGTRVIVRLPHLPS
jgi:signal transduction histidine kinase